MNNEVTDSVGESHAIRMMISGISNAQNEFYEYTAATENSRQPLYCFHFDFRYVTLVRYIYIYIYNRNNEFILEFILRERKMADVER